MALELWNWGVKGRREGGRREEGERRSWEGEGKSWMKCQVNK